MSDLIAGQVTMGDLYREITGMRQDIARSLTRIEVIDSRNGDADRLHSDHEQRLRALEAFRWKLAGIAIVVAIIVGFASAWLSSRALSPVGSMTFAGPPGCCRVPAPLLPPGGLGSRSLAGRPAGVRSLALGRVHRERQVPVAGDEHPVLAQDVPFTVLLVRAAPAALQPCQAPLDRVGRQRPGRV